MRVRLGVVVAVLVAGVCAVFAAPAGERGVVLPPCATEDSAGCVWDCAVQGNGRCGGVRRIANVWADDRDRVWCAVSESAARAAAGRAGRVIVAEVTVSAESC